MKEQPIPEIKTITCPICKKEIETRKFKAHHNKYHRLVKKPDSVPADQESTPGIIGHIDESGFVVSDESWLENQLLGDKSDTDHRSIGHSAQGKNVSKPDNTFAKIRAMDARYYTDPAPVYRRPSKYRKKNKQRSYLFPNIENLPKLILKQAIDPKKPFENNYSRKVFLQIKLPCKLCGKPVSPMEWHEHARKVHPGINTKTEYNRFLNQYFFCYECQQVYQFKDAEAHYRREHCNMIIVTMQIPKAIINNNDSK
jgi:endogenous inhibitor of DNA gyrase (YacG/DUF329 family)